MFPCAGFLFALFLMVMGGVASAQAHVVPDGFHVFSRSCGPGWLVGVRETITWSPRLAKDWFWTVSHHYALEGGFYYFLHSVNTYEKSPATNGWEFTWRSYAGHNESGVNYVQGDHYRKSGAGAMLFWRSDAHDCNPGEV